MKLFAAARRLFRILLVVIRYRLDDIMSRPADAVVAARDQLPAAVALVATQAHRVV
jgi:hypothetical protein